MQNALFVIEPYQWNGIWVFDDPRVGLVQEPFVSGMPEIIDQAVQEIPDMLLVHRRVAMREQQGFIKEPVHGAKAKEVCRHGQPDGHGDAA